MYEFLVILILLLTTAVYEMLYKKDIKCSFYTKSDSYQESKETYGQTRGLSNLEMKHVGKLAIIGALLKAVKRSCVRTYLIKHRVVSWPLLHTYYKIARVVELQPNMEW